MEKKYGKKELYNLSNQFMDLFISDVLSKNKVNISEAKERMTDEQRDKLKETVENLKNEVERYLDSNGRKTITEKDQDNKNKVSPLREKFMKKKEENSDSSQDPKDEEEKQK